MQSRDPAEVARPGGERVVLYGRPGCHLCDDARAVIAEVCAELGVAWTEVDISADEQLLARYWEQIPVTVVDGAQHDFWRVDAGRLRATLTR
ncbi:MAG TPA: glutaredoxin family protein [Nocardioidaceae bacterium]|nr:glutaredoxin family protein [Nocardioidaceae bacterium]